MDPADLRRRNLSYREPALYDELLADNDTAARIAGAIDQIGVQVRTVVDFGCGPEIDFVAADVTSARLGATFD